MKGDINAMTDTLLQKLIDEGIRENTPNEIIVEVLKSLERQQPVDFSGITEFSSDALYNIITDGELFTEDAYFKNRLKGFSVYNRDGDRLCSVEADGSVNGYMPYKFTMPSNDAVDEQTLRDFCKFVITKFDTIAYPK